MNINWTVLVASIGAAAWLPHIFYWFYDWLSKPKLHFVPEPTAEISYHLLGGPIFNQTFAISTSKKDALIEKITITIIHESGESHCFYWKFLDEKGFDMTSISGERTEFRKQQVAIALKVSPLGLVEKKIFFQDSDFQEKYNSLSNKLSEKELLLDKTASDEFETKALESKEFIDLLDFVKSGFYWREGKYTVHLSAFEASLKEPHVESFLFNLSKGEAEQLENNIEVLREELKARIVYRGIPIKEWPLQPYWHWVSPAFNRVE